MEKTMMFVRFFLGVAFTSFGLCWIEVLRAEEVPTGYIVSKANLSATDHQTFDGHNLGSMITPVMRKMIEHGLTLSLAPTKPSIVAPKLLAATEKYSKRVTFDKATRGISGYVAGIPFPNLSESDPDIADKILWNHFYADPIIADLEIANTEANSIDGTKGLERSFSLVNVNLKLKHRTSIEPVAPKMIGDGDVYKKSVLFILAPQDVAGTGAYIQRYADGRVDDSWTYIKSIRRVRRMSGGTWMDPVAGTDLVNDDVTCHDAFPTWYPKYTLVKKQWVLMVMHGPAPNELPRDKLLDSKNAPYWNPINLPWEPRQVYVIDATPPQSHPYSNRRMYYDIEAGVVPMCDLYDKKGSLWKFGFFPFTQVRMADGQPGLGASSVWFTDLQRMHSSFLPIFYISQNEARQDIEDVAPEMLINSEKFSLQGLTKRFGPSEKALQ